MEDQRFYFIHSYYVDCINKDEIIASVQYGDEITAAINKENIYGVQFHPEKSHKFGKELMTNFLNLKN